MSGRKAAAPVPFTDPMEENSAKKKKIIKLILAALLLTALFLYGLFFLRGLQEKKAPRIFGSTYMTMNNPYFTALNESIREVVEANGDLLITRDPAQDQDRQNQQILEMIDEGMTVLFANAADWTKIGPALEACREAGVAVFVVDTDVREREGIVSIIQSDNYLAGVLVARDLMKKMPRGGDIVLMSHDSVYSTVERRQGFLDTIGDREEYRIVAETHNTSEIEVATAEMNRIIQSGIHFDAVFGNNDPTALGALAGIQMNNVTDPILIYGVDGSPDCKLMIQRGLVEGSAAQYPIRIGREAAETAYRYLEGQKVQDTVLIPVTMITENNLSDFDISGWQ